MEMDRNLGCLSQADYSPSYISLHLFSNSVRAQGYMRSSVFIASPVAFPWSRIANYQFTKVR